MANYRLTNLTAEALHVRLNSNTTSVIPGGQFVVVADTEVSTEATDLRDLGYLDISVDGVVSSGNIYLPATQAARLALSVEPGFICQQQDTGSWYMLTQAPASDPAAWKEIVTGSGGGGIGGITPLGTAIVTSTTASQVRTLLDLGAAALAGIGPGPTQVAAGNHGHGISEISGLSTALADKASNSALATGLSSKLDVLVGTTEGSLLAAGPAGTIVEFGKLVTTLSSASLGVSTSDTLEFDFSSLLGGRALTDGFTLEMLLSPILTDARTDYLGNALRATVGSVSVGLKNASNMMYVTPGLDRVDEASWRKVSFLLTIRMGAGWGVSGAIPAGYVELTTMTTSDGLAYLPTPPSPDVEGGTQVVDPGVPSPPTPPTGDLSALDLGTYGVVSTSMRRTFQPNATVFSGLGIPLAPGRLVGNTFDVNTVVLRGCNAQVTNITLRTA